MRNLARIAVLPFPFSGHYRFAITNDKRERLCVLPLSPHFIPAAFSRQEGKTRTEAPQSGVNIDSRRTNQSPADTLQGCGSGNCLDSLARQVL
jgi:hypothetical protein